MKLYKDTSTSVTLKDGSIRTTVTRWYLGFIPLVLSISTKTKRVAPKKKAPVKKTPQKKKSK